MTYANPTSTPLQIEVLPAGSNAPVLVLERGAPEFRPVAPGALARIPRGDMRPASSVPPIQADNLRRSNTPETTRTIDVQATTVRDNRRNPNPQPRPRMRAPDIASEIDEGSAYGVAGLGFGVFDELSNVPRDEAFRTNAALDFYEFYSGYEVGRSATAGIRDTLRDIRDVRLPRIDIPELRLPNVRLPEIALPRFDLPGFRLPRIDLPRVDIPSLHWPDLNIPSTELPPDYQNNHDYVDQIRERERDRVNDRNNPVPQPPPSAATELPILLPKIPNGCYLSVIMMTYGIRTYSSAFIASGTPDEIYNSYMHFRQITPGSQTPSMPGVGNAPYIDTVYDQHGNSWDRYDNPSGGMGEDLEGFSLTIEDETYPPNANNQITIYQQAVQNGITNTYDLNILASKIDLSKWAIVGKQMSCYGGTGCSLDPPAYEPPPPPPSDIPKKRKPPDMACCTCAQIASIVNTSLAALKQILVVPIVSCELQDGVWTPVVTSTPLVFFANDATTALSFGQLYLQLANQAIDLCQAKNSDIQAIADAIGVGEYPASLPSSLISKDQGWLGNLVPGQNVQIPNLTKLISWFIERFDEIMGQFEIPIQIKDSDPTTPGDQPKGLKIQNVAEGIAEATGLLLQIAYNSEALININTRTLLETGGDKIQNFKTYMLLEALSEYVGFKINEVEKTVSLTFKPGEKELTNLLKEHQQKVIVADFDEKTDFQAVLMKLMEAASIIKARYFRKIDINGNATEQILNVLKQSQSLGKKVNDNESDPQGNNSFDQFRNQVEEGFINEPGVTNSTNPYGKPYNERPKIRDVD